MPDITALLRNWWKQIFILIVLSLIAISAINFFKPRQYLSVTTAVPASSFIADKSKIFSENVQELYSALGVADDLDRIVGTAKLDTAYLAVTDQFNLYDHYQIKSGPGARGKAASWLKKNSRVMKSEYGELKISVWDTDPQLAPQLADAIMQQLNNIHSNLQNQENLNTLNAIKKTKEKLSAATDSANQTQQLNKLEAEYQLMIDSKPPALLMVENAKASSCPDRPKWMKSLVTTAVLAFLIGLLLALFLERRKNNRP